MLSGLGFPIRRRSERPSTGPRLRAQITHTNSRTGSIFNAAGLVYADILKAFLVFSATRKIGERGSRQPVAAGSSVPSIHQGEYECIGPDHCELGCWLPRWCLHFRLPQRPSKISKISSK